MRVLVHDFSGHPFQAELARALASRGHEVLHVQCDSYASGKGSFTDGAGGNPRYLSISLGRPFERYRTRQRLLDEASYGRRFIQVCRDFGPDVVISCNDPLAAKALFGAWAALRHVHWVFWLQDVYSIAMTREVEKRSTLGRQLGKALQWVERRLLRSADAVVAITEDFGPTLDAWGVAASKRTVIENWAPLDEVPQRPRDNAFRAKLGIGDRFLYVYAGTLGLKHDPSLLRRLAEADPSAEVVVVSEGLGADQLRHGLEEAPLSNLHVLGYQPWEDLPDVLGAGDALVVLLEAEAGAFSVPSKILTCLCAGRPILGSIPADNLGARTITGTGAGIVVAPGEVQGFMAAAEALRNDPEMRARMSKAARQHAEVAFDIDSIAGRFNQIIQSIGRARPSEVD
jgi:glycosyltransferase involved in cell wall biosynthesis